MIQRTPKIVKTQPPAMYGGANTIQMIKGLSAGALVRIQFGENMPVYPARIANADNNQTEYSVVVDGFNNDQPFVVLERHVIEAESALPGLPGRVGVGLTSRVLPQSNGPTPGVRFFYTEQDDVDWVQFVSLYLYAEGVPLEGQALYFGSGDMLKTLSTSVKETFYVDASHHGTPFLNKVESMKLNEGDPKGVGFFDPPLSGVQDIRFRVASGLHLPERLTIVARFRTHLKRGDQTISTVLWTSSSICTVKKYEAESGALTLRPLSPKPTYEISNVISYDGGGNNNNNNNNLYQGPAGESEAWQQYEKTREHFQKRSQLS